MKYRNPSLLILKPFERGCRNFENVATCLAWTMCFMRYDWANDAIHVRMWQCVLLWLLWSVGQQCQRGKGKPWPISEMIQEIQRRSLSDLYAFQKYFWNRINDLYKYLLPLPPKIYLFHGFAGFYKVLKHFCSFPPKPWIFKRDYLYIFIYIDIYWHKINLFIRYYLFWYKEIFIRIWY